MAFFAGLMQENLASKAGSLKDQVTDLQDTLGRMESKALFFLNHDLRIAAFTLENKVEITLLDRELESLNSTLTPEERENYLRTIVELIIHDQNLINVYLVIDLYKHFNASTNDFVIATEAADGYHYRITWDMWQRYVDNKGLPIRFSNAYEAYGNLWSYSMIQSLPLAWHPYSPITGKEIFVREIGLIMALDFFLYSPIMLTQDVIAIKLYNARILESQAQYISLGVSLTTVSMVLASAMITRINHKKIEYEFTLLKEKEGKEVKRKPDILSIPVLIVAALLSTLGIILAFI